MKEQFIMAYGGLRGAVGFSLVSMVNQSDVPAAQMFLTTTLAVIMFTVFLQGEIQYCQAQVQVPGQVPGQVEKVQGLG